eukprot:6205627-Pleurochrysis_carterae.AAC.2
MPHLSLDTIADFVHMGSPNYYSSCLLDLTAFNYAPTSLNTLHAICYTSAKTSSPMRQRLRIGRWPGKA